MRNISDFIKDGQNHASIKIELKHDDDNVIIICLITRADNRTQWTLNGEKTTLENIQSIVESFNVQMSPPELLILAQEATGEKELLGCHRSLIKLSELKNLLSKCNLRKRCCTFQREAILRKIQLQQAKISMAQYSLSKTTFEEMGREKRAVEEKYNQLLEENQLAIDSKNECEEIIIDAIEKKKNIPVVDQSLIQIMKDIGKLGRQIQDKDDILRQASDRLSEEIGCAGVHISTHEDYGKWGINFLVNFSDNEELQLLTGQRQSGDERSVLAIMYLMALQELAKIPFCVVEINQGLDPINEYLVHNQMIETAYCNLKYHNLQWFFVSIMENGNLKE
ncbi:15319_t:CDS:10 [Entrophospora sp. SA101]|nr:15319_t:CDS:10 [Entrophospora sp. SA101]